ncbi:hypothetical protein D5S18_12220 [Nocardia panacis]|uniref:Uncharacterized protein n=1 Tax=Nocardia panacis TaxID=2340916 RepID=A0A3A4KJW8_9NOCA|nr:hypothetical protein [Nocardia panacis]RJO76964.1 hypothetical protein D5S18_12220 [Nocardia panacis]
MTRYPTGIRRSDTHVETVAADTPNSDSGGDDTADRTVFGTCGPPAPANAAARDAADAKGRMWVGPTSEQTRRLVAESRLRQGLPAGIENPAVIESLALFLRNALNTLDADEAA